MKTTRIAPGVYDVRANGRLFEIEQYEDGLWGLFEVFEGTGKDKDYWNHFMTKRAAQAAISKELSL